MKYWKRWKLKIKYWKHWTLLVSILATILLLAGFPLLVVGLYSKKGFLMDLGIYLIPIGLAFIAISLSLKSGERLTTIANATFMEIVDIFEDKRIQFYQHPEWLGLEGTIWKCKTYVDRAYYLHKSAEIDEKNRRTLFEWFCYLIYGSGINWDLKKVDNLKFLTPNRKDVNNLLEMVKKFRDFDLRDEDLKQLNTIEEKLKNFMEK